MFIFRTLDSFVWIVCILWIFNTVYSCGFLNRLRIFRMCIKYLWRKFASQLRLINGVDWRKCPFIHTCSLSAGQEAKALGLGAVALSFSGSYSLSYPKRRSGALFLFWLAALEKLSAQGARGEKLKQKFNKFKYLFLFGLLLMFLIKIKSILKCFLVPTNLLNHAVSLFCSMHKGCLLMGDDSNSLSRPPSLSFYVSLGSLKTPHTHTQMRHQNYYTTNCLASSAVWRNRMLWVVKRENRFRVLFPP